MVDKEACMALCNLNINCNFIFLTDSNICIMHQSCDEMQRTESVGSTFAKSSCPGYYLSLDNYSLFFFFMMINGNATIY